MATYFFDFNNGNDGNSGTQLSPWKNPFNKQGNFSAGDTVKCRKGTVLRNNGGFTLTANGTSGNPITWTWYAESGDPDIPPTITGLRNLGTNWTSDATANIWYIGLSIPASSFSTVKDSAANLEGVFENMRLWVSTSSTSNDAAAQPYSGTKGGLSASATWFMDSDANRLYIYSTTDPNTDGKLRELLYPGDSNVTNDAQIYFNNASFNTFDGIRIEGGQGTIRRTGSVGCKFLNCEIRRSTQKAIQSLKEWTVRSCTLDQVANINEGDYTVGRSVNVDNGNRDAMTLGSNNSNAKIEFNLIKDYNHGGINFKTYTAIATGFLGQYNEITVPNQKWGRAFEFRGPAGINVTDPIVRWNLGHDLIVENKMGGLRGLYYGNVIWDQTRKYTTGTPADPNEIAPITLGGDNGEFKNCKIIHNTVVNCRRWGVKVVQFETGDVDGNDVSNNLLVDTSTDTSKGDRQSIWVSQQGNFGLITNNSFRNNCLHRDGTDVTVNYFGTTYTPTQFNGATLSQGNTASGNLYFDPAFLDKANKDFRLNATDTTLIGGGVNLGDASLLDRDGNAYDPDYDIGAYVFTSGGGAEPEEKIGSGGGLELGLSSHYRFLIENQTGVTLAANSVNIYALRAKYTNSGEPDYESSEALYSNGSSVPDGSFGQLEVITNQTNKWLGGWFIAEVTTPTGANGDVSISFQMSTNEGARWPSNKSTSMRLVTLSFSGVDTQSKNFIL